MIPTTKQVPETRKGRLHIPCGNRSTLPSRCTAI